MARDPRHFRYLNDAGLWPGFHWQRLLLDDAGTLRLAGLPRLEEGTGAGLAAAPSDPLPAGVAQDAAGSVYFSDPVAHCLWRIEGCDGRQAATPCIGAHGVGPGRLNGPAGLAISAAREVLYVADSGNHCVKVFDLASLDVMEVLGGFDTPLALALDGGGQLYVVDTGARRVELVTGTGDRVSAFGDMVARHVADPVAVCCHGSLVYVLARGAGDLWVFSREGMEGMLATGIDGARVFTLCDEVLYIADPGQRRIAVWRGDEGRYSGHAGDAAGYDGPVAALAPDGAGGLLAAPGGAVAPLRLQLDGSHAPEGWLWSDALSFGSQAHCWNRVAAVAELPAGTHIAFFVATGPAGMAPPPTDGGFGAPWRAVGTDITDFCPAIDEAPQAALWLGARLTNDLHATPALAQARVDFDDAGYLDLLPAIYRPDDDGDFLRRYLALFESFFDELESQVGLLPVLLDPAGAPARALPWLAGFLALPEVRDATEEHAQRRLLERGKDGTQGRAAIAGAHARHGRRGTVAGLREALREQANVAVLIDEPLQAAGWWGLPAPSGSCEPAAAGTWTDGGCSVLGLNTVLAHAEAQGAVAGTTAMVGRSQLIADEAFGSPLFEDTAYRFVVRLYPAQLGCAGGLERLRAIIDREKPAHTFYDVGVIEPGLRVGLQATLGVDTLLGGGPPAPAPLGAGPLVLGGQPRARLGIDSRVGIQL